MPRLTEGAAFRQLVELAGLKMAAGEAICCYCGRALSQHEKTRYALRLSFPRFELTFNVCSAPCAYEFGRQTAAAVALLMRPVSSNGVRVRGGSRPTRTSGTTTGERRKSATPARKAAKRQRRRRGTPAAHSRQLKETEHADDDW